MKELYESIWLLSSRLSRVIVIRISLIWREHNDHSTTTRLKYGHENRKGKKGKCCFQTSQLEIMERISTNTFLYLWNKGTKEASSKDEHETDVELVLKFE